MAKKSARSKKQADQTADQLPGPDQILKFLDDHPERSGKREIARAFGIKGDRRADLKLLLKDMAVKGLIEKAERRRFARPGSLPPVAVVEIVERDVDGEFLCRTPAWKGDGDAPRIVLSDSKAGRGRGALGLVVGARFLARLERHDDHYAARIMRPLDGHDQGRELGVFHKAGQGGVVAPVNKRKRHEYKIAGGDALDARSGDLVFVEPLRGPRDGDRRARIVERLGSLDQPRSISLIAIHEHGIPFDFPDGVVAEAEAVADRPPGPREDLRDVPLITIDPPDARDHDDAVWAAPDDDPKNPGGHVVMVAIADVAHYVAPGSALDREALRRGNSCYFPDRVVPMLPERLSSDRCSLLPGEDRPCLAVRMVFAADGRQLSHRFVRGLMRSAAKLSYAQMQAAGDGSPDRLCAPLMTAAIEPLWRAYRAVAQARDKRAPLALELPETKIQLDDQGQVAGIARRAMTEAERLIEAFMIEANVAAAQTLERRKVPLLYRVHEPPSKEKIDALGEVVKSIGLPFAKGQAVKPKQFNLLIDRAAGTEFANLIHEIVLRTQSQARYAPDALGHFGLNLRSYAHFTSPIRRYADLVVHRALIAGLGLGSGGLAVDDRQRLDLIAETVSGHERRAMAAERDSVDRYMAAYLEPQRGAQFEGLIAGVSHFGLFVRLDETGADGLIPIRTLPDDYYHHDEDAHALVGRHSGLRFRLGDRITTRLEEAAPLSGGLRLAYVGNAGEGPAKPRPPRRHGAKRGPATAKPPKPKAKRAGPKGGPKPKKRKAKRKAR